MTRTHRFILDLFDERAVLRKNLEKSNSPFLPTARKRILIPRNLTYNVCEDTQLLMMRKLKRQDVPDTICYDKAICVQNFLAMMRWTLNPNQVGITWVELFALFWTHSTKIARGRENETPRFPSNRTHGPSCLKRAHLEKYDRIQKALTDFKVLTRTIAKRCMTDEVEEHFKPATTPENRLKVIGVKNSFTTIRGMPKFTEDESKQILKVLLALRGNSTRNASDKLENCSLALIPKRMRLKTTTKNICEVLRTCGGLTAVFPRKRIIVGQVTLNTIFCRTCGWEFEIGKTKLLINSSNFTNVHCHGCHLKVSTYEFNCGCDMRWISALCICTGHHP